MSDFKAKMHQI